MRRAQQGVLVLQAGPNVLRFVPPLTITEKEMKEGTKRFGRAIEGYVTRTSCGVWRNN